MRGVRKEDRKVVILRINHYNGNQGTLDCGRVMKHQRFRDAESFQGHYHTEGFYYKVLERRDDGKETRKD